MHRVLYVGGKQGRIYAGSAKTRSEAHKVNPLRASSVSRKKTVRPESDTDYSLSQKCNETRAIATLMQYHLDGTSREVCGVRRTLRGNHVRDPDRDP